MARRPTVYVDFVANTAKLVKGINSVTDASGRAEKGVKGINWKRLGLVAAGATAAAGTKLLKDSIDATTQLAKDTMALSRVTGMDTKTASEWVTVLKSRGIATEVFSKGMVTLSKQMTAAAAGSKTSVAAFKALGVSMEDVRKGDTQAVINQVADGLSRMKNPAKQAALTQQLFSRSGQKLAPILYKGSQAIADQLGIAEKYGATLGDKTTTQVADLAQKQREMKIASEGVKIQLGTALLPAVLKVALAIGKLVDFLQPILRSGPALATIIGVIAAAYGFMAIMSLQATLAQLGLNIAMLPLTAIIVGIIAAVVALIVIWKNWDKITQALGAAWNWLKDQADKAFKGILAVIQYVWNWVKRNWPLLLGILTGPIGLAAALIYKNWDTIKKATATAWNAVKSAISTAVSSIKSIVGTLTSYVTNTVTAIHTWLTKLSGWFGDVYTKVKGVVADVKSKLGEIATWFVNNASKIRDWLTTVAGWFGKPYSAAKDMVRDLKAKLGEIPGAISAIVEKVTKAAASVANAIKAPINKVIGAWNDIDFKVPKITLPKINTHIPGVGTVGGGSVGGWTIPFPDIPKLAAGGIVTAPTLALVGERGPEMIAPLSGRGGFQVRVFIGETELRGIVRTEVVSEDSRTAQTLLGGLA